MAARGERPDPATIVIDDFHLLTTPEERLDLLEQLWDSLAATPEAVPLSLSALSLIGGWTSSKLRVQLAFRGTRF